MSFGEIKGSIGFGKQTQTAGTKIQQLIRPLKRARTRIRAWAYLCGTTAHTLTVRPAIGYGSVVAAGAAAAATTITLQAQPTGLRNIATNDIFVIEQPITFGPTGVLRMDFLLVKPSSITGLALTVSALTYAIPGNARVWLMALDTDVCPGYGNQAAPPQWTTTVSVVNYEPGGNSTTNVGNSGANDIGVFTSFGDYEPLLWESNNITAAGTLQELQADYLRVAA
jgi:hypothetical protein